MQHGQTISTVSVQVPAPGLSEDEIEKLDGWLRRLLWEYEFPDGLDSPRHVEIHRAKGRLPCSDGSVKMVQGVREVFEIFDSPQQRADEGPGADGEGKLVLIGRHIQNLDFSRSLMEALGRGHGA